MSASSTSLTVHNLRVTLLDVSPPVWRLVRVPSPLPLSALHSILQVAMGWQDRHLHEWRVGDVYYDGGDDAEVVLADVAPADSVLHYTYDLSDGWEHLVEVVSVEPFDPSSPPIAVLEGARAVPPEESGGPEGYGDLLAALENPSDLDHPDVALAYGDFLDPEVFDRDLVNRRLEAFWRLPEE